MTTPFPFQSAAVLLASQLNAITTLVTSTKTASHTLTIADVSTRVIMNSASATTITVNTSIFGASDVVEILNIGAGVCTVTAGSCTVGTSGTLALVQNAGGTLTFISASASVFRANGVTATANQIAIFNESQAQGTNGGTFTAGSYVKRTLNTTVVNQITSCTLTSSVISLPAGSYQVIAIAPAFRTGGHKTRLQNTTAATTIDVGNQQYTDSAGDYASNLSTIQTFFTLSTTSNIELQHQAQVTKTGNGLGVSVNFTGSNEMYAQITITKVA